MCKSCAYKGGLSTDKSNNIIGIGKRFCCFIGVLPDDIIYSPFPWAIASPKKNPPSSCLRIICSVARDLKDLSWEKVAGAECRWTQDLVCRDSGNECLLFPVELFIPSFFGVRVS